MPLSVGDKVGHYQILGPLGAGGMGEVYPAIDTKLNWPVAVKLLSDELADAAARRRFQREAQMASSLNHPHILTVHDAGENDGRRYLVTEYIDGRTLKDRPGIPGSNHQLARGRGGGAGGGYQRHSQAIVGCGGEGGS